MNFDGVESVVCDAEENDWLDVTYSERKYVAEKPARKNLWTRISLKWKILSVVCACVLVFVGMLAIDGNFRKGVFETAKNAYASVVSVFDGKQNTVGNKIDIPCNTELKDVKDGVATFGGGRATLAFAGGKVTEVTDNSVTVQLSDELSVRYGDLSDIYVAVGDSVAANALLGKYDQTFTATILQNGEAVTDVVASETEITWKI